MSEVVAKRQQREIDELKRSTVRMRRGIVTDDDPLTVSCGGADEEYTNLWTIPTLYSVGDAVMLLIRGHDALVLGSPGDIAVPETIPTILAGPGLGVPPGSSTLEVNTGTGLGIVSDAVAITDAELLAILGLTSAANKLPYFTGSGTASLADLTAFARTLLDDADAATARTTLGAAAASHSHSAADITSGTLDNARLDSELSALAGLTSAADKGIQFTGSGTAGTFDLTTAGKALLDDANASAQRTTLGLAIGTDVQAYDPELAALAGLTSAADKMPYFTGSGTAAVATVTSFIRGLLDDTDAATARTTLGVPATADVEPWRVDLDPFVTPSTQTNWNTNQVDNTRIKGGYLLSSGAQNAEIGWDIVLSAGTWTFTLLHIVGTNRGIYTVSLDGSSIGTIDGYAAAGANALSTITGVSVATSGKKRLLLKMATKNGSSSNYFGTIQGVALFRTA